MSIVGTLEKTKGLSCGSLQEVDVKTCSKEWKFNEPNSCYFNAAMETLHSRGQYSYCLGLAEDEQGNYHEHAWIYDHQESKYIDPTWNDEIGNKYFLFTTFNSESLISYFNQVGNIPMFDEIKLSNHKCNKLSA